MPPGCNTVLALLLVLLSAPGLGAHGHFSAGVFHASSLVDHVQMQVRQAGLFSLGERRTGLGREGAGIGRAEPGRPSPGDPPGISVFRGRIAAEQPKSM